MLLVLGASMPCGGLKHGEQRFSRDRCRPQRLDVDDRRDRAHRAFAVFAQSQPVPSVNTVVHLSTGIAVVLVLTYLLSLVFFFRPGGGRPHGREG